MIFFCLFEGKWLIKPDKVNQLSSVISTNHIFSLKAKAHGQLGMSNQERHQNTRQNKPGKLAGSGPAEKQGLLLSAGSASKVCTSFQTPPCSLSKILLYDALLFLFGVILIEFLLALCFCLVNCTQKIKGLNQQKLMKQWS